MSYDLVDKENLAERITQLHGKVQGLKVTIKP